jgi:hypothetical protein
MVIYSKQSLNKKENTIEHKNFLANFEILKKSTQMANLTVKFDCEEKNAEILKILDEIFCLEPEKNKIVNEIRENLDRKLRENFTTKLPLQENR